MGDQGSVSGYARLAIVGGGRMGEALAATAVNGGLRAADIVVVEPDPSSAAVVRCCPNLPIARGSGFTTITPGDGVRPEQLRLVESLFSAGGPGGATIAGVRVLEERAVRGAFMAAAAAGVERARELAEAVG